MNSVRLWALLLGTAAAVVIGGSASAQGQVLSFCGDTGVAPYSRCVATFKPWLYGVGVKQSALGVTNQNLCVGAKTNADGSGGNAIPFRCEVLAAYQEIWTAGGNSNWGYGTVINNNPHHALASGLLNFRA